MQILIADSDSSRAAQLAQRFANHGCLPVEDFIEPSDADEARRALNSLPACALVVAESDLQNTFERARNGESAPAIVSAEDAANMKLPDIFAAVAAAFGHKADCVLRAQNVELDMASEFLKTGPGFQNKLFVGKEELKTSGTIFNLLRFMMLNPTLLSRKTLAAAIFDPDTGPEQIENNLKMYLTRMRKALKGSGLTIENVHDRGWILCAVSKPLKPVVELGPVAIHLNGKVTYDGVAFGLTPQERELLEMFMRNPGRVYTREGLLNHLHPDTPEAERPGIQLVDVLIANLRRKIAKASGEKNVIQTVRDSGLGYGWQDPQDKVLRQKAASIEPLGTILHWPGLNLVIDTRPNVLRILRTDTGQHQKISKSTACIVELLHDQPDQVWTKNTTGHRLGSTTNSISGIIKRFRGLLDNLKVDPEWILPAPAVTSLGDCRGFESSGYRLTPHEEITPAELDQILENATKAREQPNTPDAAP